jgi:choline-sulfatase
MSGKANILIIMVDQLNGTLFPDGPAEFLHAPHLKALAARSARFVNNYTASPLCAPGRAAFMSGQLPSRTGVYDNAAEFPSSIPTYAHHLRAAGYHTCLSGKMHFVGPDQLHGFEERLTTDIYPADFGWTPDYRKPGERIDWWYHNLGSVKGAGVAEISNQMEYDDEVAFHAVQKLYQLSRESEDEGRRPWCLTVSFTHPHDPFVARRKYWDLYEDCAYLEPRVPAIPFEEQDPHSQRLYHAADYENFDIRDEDIRRSRRAYFANISYLDDHIGTILDTLKHTRMEGDTLVVFCADHGEMLGERGLWFKMSFFEGSARVPLMMAAPGRFRPARIDEPTSLLDILPTLVELAEGDVADIPTPLDGTSLMDLASEAAKERRVVAEYAAEGAVAPMVMIREGRYKFVHCPVDADQLFDLAEDPHELNNLASHSAFDDVVASMRRAIEKRWNLDAYNADVLASQARRHLVYGALRNGAYFPWDFQPLRAASERYMRNHMDLNVLEANARFPRNDTDDR